MAPGWCRVQAVQCGVVFSPVGDRGLRAKVAVVYQDGSQGSLQLGRTPAGRR
jgi:hypothetical protein